MLLLLLACTHQAWSVSVSSAFTFALGFSVTPHANFRRRSLLPQQQQQQRRRWSDAGPGAGIALGMTSSTDLEQVEVREEAGVEIQSDKDTEANPVAISMPSLSTEQEGGAPSLWMNPLESFDPDPEEEEEAALTSSSSSSSSNANIDGDEYQRGLLTVGFITFLFSTNSPVLHGALSGNHPPPVLLVNAAVSLVALVGLVLSPSKATDERTTTTSATIATTTTPTPKPPSSFPDSRSNPSWVGGLELGAWKFLGTTLNLYGLALTTASHGALLIQLTTVLVPSARGILYGERIADRVKLSIGLAVVGVLLFSRDGLCGATAAATSTDLDATTKAAADALAESSRIVGDGLCVLAAVCYSAYDLRLYEHGKRVGDDKELITNKIGVQAALSVLLLSVAPSLQGASSLSPSSAWSESADYLFWLAHHGEAVTTVLPAVVWSGVAVNAVAPLLQVGGQRAVGPTKCQTLYASQPLWAAILSYLWLGETLGVYGMVGGGAFLVALALAATAETTETATAMEETTIVRSTATTPTTTTTTSTEKSATIK